MGEYGTEQEHRQTEGMVQRALKQDEFLSQELILLKEATVQEGKVNYSTRASYKNGRSS